jgi:hypothetical protein
MGNLLGMDYWQRTANLQELSKNEVLSVLANLLATVSLKL